MPVILTSDNRASFVNAKKFIVSNLTPSPAGFTVLKIFTLSKTFPISPLVTRASVADYKNNISKLFLSRWQAIEQFLLGLQKDKDYVVCCPCLDTELAQKQLTASGRFLCHIGLIGRLIQKYRSDIDVVLVDKYREMLPVELMPVKSICVFCDLSNSGDYCGIESACVGPYKNKNNTILTINLLHQHVTASL